MNYACTINILVPKLHKMCYYFLSLMHFVLHLGHNWGLFINSVPGWSLNPDCHGERIPRFFSS